MADSLDPLRRRFVHFVTGQADRAEARPMRSDAPDYVNGYNSPDIFAPEFLTASQTLQFCRENLHVRDGWPSDLPQLPLEGPMFLPELFPA